MMSKNDPLKNAVYHHLFLFLFYLFIFCFHFDFCVSYDRLNEFAFFLSNGTMLRFMFSCLDVKEKGKLINRFACLNGLVNQFL